jgi:L-ribulose-5-phosphate 3-epimerase
MPNLPSLSRRELLGAMCASAAFAQSGAEPLRISTMSKFFQFLDIAGMARAMKGIGLDGVDLCVRAGAHVLPERAEEDLPKALETIRREGSELLMITTAIADSSTPHAEKLLRTARRLGIRHYRWGGLRYDLSRPIAPQLEALKPRVAELAAMNKEIGICAMYHTHSGIREVGASIWDLWMLLKDHDPRWVSVNLDVGHATVEGGYGGWIHSTNLVLPMTRGTAIKDFKWGRNAKGQWVPQWCPLGEGMVDFRKYLGMLKQAGFSGPVQLHYEYPLQGVDEGSRQTPRNPERIYAAMRKDLDLLRTWMREAQLT